MNATQYQIMTEIPRCTITIPNLMKMQPRKHEQVHLCMDKAFLQGQTQYIAHNHKAEAPAHKVNTNFVTP